MAQPEQAWTSTPSGRDAHRSVVGVVRLGVALALAAGVGWLAWMSLQVERPRESPVQTISVLEQARPDPVEPEIEPEPLEDYEEPAASEEFVELTEAPADAGDTLDDGLGLDADGSGGRDGFGLRAKRGGRSLIGAESGSGDDSAAAWRGFAALVARRLERILNGTETIRTANYDVRLRLWLEADGRVMRAEIAGSSGVTDIDAAIVKVLESRRATLGPPPPDMPQPVNIRVRSRRAG